MVILLVEDDVRVQYFIWKLLKADGHTVLAAATAKPHWKHPAIIPAQLIC